ncbi:MAG: hypothetical protein ACE5GW_00920 [Planctomycetota bacterium]
MIDELAAILCLALLCGGWVLFQRWIARRAPEAPDLEERCRGCGDCASDRREQG